VRSTDRQTRRRRGRRAGGEATRHVRRAGFARSPFLFFCSADSAALPPAALYRSTVVPDLIRGRCRLEGLPVGLPHPVTPGLTRGLAVLEHSSKLLALHATMPR
jgi:hypothetical protein